MLTSPVYLAIFIIKIVRYRKLLKDLEVCIFIVSDVNSRCCSEISNSLICTLIVAEDHRNSLHLGVDPIAIIRALKQRCFQGVNQGASTIEQQLVRTITGRYEKTPRRKFREQILAVMLCECFSKRELSVAYLKVAYYGHSLIGMSGIRKLSAQHSQMLDEVIVAHLKYPKPSVFSERQERKHSGRVQHIRRLLDGELKLLFYVSEC